MRYDILIGEHKPGARLLTASLCERYSISNGMLREILPRLAGEGLVVAEPQRGFRVADVSEEALQHITEARVLIESVTLRQAIDHGGVEYESRLVAAHHTLVRTPVLDVCGTVSADWLAAHSGFHHELLAGCPNERLRTMADSLRDSTEIYRCWAGQLGDEQDRDVAAEHRRIVDAVLVGDADTATAELTEHIEHTTRILLRFAQSPADPVLR